MKGVLLDRLTYTVQLYDNDERIMSSILCFLWTGQ